MVKVPVYHLGLKGRLVSFCLVLFFISACGSANKIFVTSKDKERVDLLLQLSKYYYDKSDFDKSIQYALKAREIHPTSEIATQNLASGYFAKAGFSFLNVISKLSSLTLSSSGDTSDLLGSFAGLLSLTQTDLLAMTDGVSTSTNQFLTGLDVYYPAKPGNVTDATSPRAKVDTLKYLNLAIKELCPYISDADTLAKMDTNSRYQCTKSTVPVISQTQADFLFAISHLLEAIVFHSVLLYEPSTFSGTASSSSSSSTSSSVLSGNLLARANRLNGTSVTLSVIGDYVSAITQLQTDVSKVLDTSADSMLQQIVLDFNVAAMALKSIPGMPASVSDNIENTLKSLESAVDSASSEQDKLNAQAGTFKEQLNKTLIPTLKESIVKLNSELPTVTARTAEQKEQLQQVCDAFSSIIEGTTEALPTACN